MQQALVLDFLKELSVGFKSAKSYPPGHPIMEKVVASTLSILLKIFPDYPEFSFYFLEKTVIFQDSRFDVSKNLAVLSFMEALRKNEIESLTFSSGANNDDVKNLYEVLSSSKLKIKEYGGPAEMLKAKGTVKIKINAVKFGVQAGPAVQVIQEKIAPEPAGAGGEIVEIVDLIEDFKRLIERGLSALDIKRGFEKIVESGEKISVPGQILHSEAVARILENLPYQHRIELLKDVELKPFVLKILSNLNEEKLLELIVSRSEQTDEVKKVLGTISEDKFAKLLPMLKEKIPNIYEYLAQMGLLLTEKLTASFSREDLQSTINPYYNMLDSPNARVREEGVKSLCILAGRFIQQGYSELGNEIVQRLSLALEQEPSFEVVHNSIEEIYNLYKTAKSANLTKVCDTLVEPFNRILGRAGIPVSMKRALINFMGETQNPSVLPALISFLWESGIYPEVRSAIVKIGKDAVAELLMILKDAEDYSLRMKIIDILKNIGKDGLEVLLKNIDAPEWYMRRNIVYILGEIGSSEMCPHLEILINDPEDRVRLELTRTFTKLNYESGLKNLLRDSAIEIRAEALRGLRKIISDDELIALLPSLKEKGDAFHAELLKLIGERKIKEGFSWIVDYLRNLSLRDDQTAQDLKQVALSALLKISQPEIKVVLEEFVNSRDKFLASLAQTALKRID
ncbi:MAG: HEAT repeat domain-containing protein [candidate division WOR-3 bacterium]|nr:HEAT repeat domain-containing protein [candidate division WOR-3 bacterium]